MHQVPFPYFYHPAKMHQTNQHQNDSHMSPINCRDRINVDDCNSVDHKVPTRSPTHSSSPINFCARIENYSNESGNKVNRSGREMQRRMQSPSNSDTTPDDVNVEID